MSWDFSTEPAEDEEARGIIQENAYVIIAEDLLKIQSTLASLSCINIINEPFRAW